MYLLELKWRSGNIRIFVCHQGRVTVCTYFRNICELCKFVIFFLILSKKG